MKAQAVVNSATFGFDGSARSTPARPYFYGGRLIVPLLWPAVSISSVVVERDGVTVDGGYTVELLSCPVPGAAQIVPAAWVPDPLRDVVRFFAKDPHSPMLDPSSPSSVSRFLSDGEDALSVATTAVAYGGSFVAFAFANGVVSVCREAGLSPLAWCRMPNLLSVEGSPPSVNDLCFVDGDLWIATNDGIYKLSRSQIQGGGLAIPSSVGAVAKGVGLTSPSVSGDLATWGGDFSRAVPNTVNASISFGDGEGVEVAERDGILRDGSGRARGYVDRASGALSLNLVGAPSVESASAASAAWLEWKWGVGAVSNPSVVTPRGGGVTKIRSVNVGSIPVAMILSPSALDVVYAQTLQGARVTPDSGRFSCAEIVVDSRSGYESNLIVYYAERGVGIHRKMLDAGALEGWTEPDFTVSAVDGFSFKNVTGIQASVEGIAVTSMKGCAVVSDDGSDLELLTRVFR